jgi:Domain of unknown function (DUF4178)
MSARGTCPSCGAPVSFRFEHARVTTCAHCQSTVALKGGALHDLGRRSEVVASESGLEPFRRGRFEGMPFTLMGRTVLEHPKGGRWSEWYAACEDGSVAWLAEAQGEFLLMRETPKVEGEAVPAYDALAPGSTVELVGKPFVVKERQTRVIVASEGEVPFSFEFGASGACVDLASRDGSVATLDFAFEEPALYVGRVVTLEQLGIDVRPGARDAKHEATEALACGNCGGPIKLAIPGASRRVTCTACGSLHEVEGTRHVLLETLAHAAKSPVQLGTRFRHENTEWQLVGWVERSVTSEGVRYPWHEYVVYAAVKGFRYLVQARGHWIWVTPEPTFARPMPTEDLPTLEHEGATYTLFAHDHAVVDAVAGEFPWRVRVGEQTEAFDYVAAPHVLSCEGDASEVNWSRGVHLERSTVAGFFPGVSLPVAEGVGMLEPNPYDGVGRLWWRSVLVSALLFFVLLLLRPSREAMTEMFPLPQGAVAAANASEGVVLTSAPFELQGDRRLTIELDTDTPLDAYVDYVVDLLDSRDSPVESVRAASTFERDEEGDAVNQRIARVTLGHVPPGTYRLRVDAISSSPEVRMVLVTVREGGVAFGEFVLCQLVAFLTLLPFAFLRQKFEFGRNAASDFSASGFRQFGVEPGESSSGDDDSDDDDNDSGGGSDE